jgi:hypothetical protein
MGNTFKDSGDYRIEISGWGLDNIFFVERTLLLWVGDGKKQVHLRRALAAGQIVFLRLLSTEPSNLTVPLAYAVEHATTMDCEGVCRISLVRMRPCSKESPGRENASKFAEDPKRERNVHEESVADWQREEVLQ